MKMKIPHKPIVISLACLSLLLAPLGASAAVIGFDNYTPASNLDGQPSTGTQWSGGGADFIVTAGAGVGGSGGVVTAPRSSSSATSVFSPSLTDLPGFNGSSSILNVSFQFRLSDLPDTNSNSATVAAIQFGWIADANTAVRFYVTADGRLGYNNGASSSILVSNFGIHDTATWTTVSATLNYATQTYAFALNGVPYATAGGTSVFNFRGPTTGSAFRLTNTGSASHRGVAFDNISATVVPEPASAALLFPFVIAGGLVLRKRRKQ